MGLCFGSFLLLLLESAIMRITITTIASTIAAKSSTFRIAPEFSPLELLVVAVSE